MPLGKFIYFLDSDDSLLPDVLEKMVDFGENNDLDVAGFNVLKSNDKLYFSITNYPKSPLTGQEYFYSLYNIRDFLPAIPVWMYLYKKEFLDNYSLRFKEGIIHEDVLFSTIALFLAKKVMLLNIPIQFHRVYREGAITQNVTKRHAANLLLICRELYAFLQVNDCGVKPFYDRIFQMYINAASKILIVRNFKDKIFTKQDYSILKKCLINEGWIMHYLLLRYGKFKFYEWYINNNKFYFIKKTLRSLSKLYWRLFIQNV